MKIGIFGSAIDSSESVRKKVVELAGELAKYDCEIVTGACNGLPQLVVETVRRNNANIKITGFSPTISKEAHLKQGYPYNEFTNMVYVPDDYEYKDNPLVCRKYRNVSSCAYVDIAIIVSGRCGTLNEFTNAFDMGKDIAVLKGTGGIADNVESLVGIINKRTISNIIIEEGPKKLVSFLMK